MIVLALALATGELAAQDSIPAKLRHLRGASKRELLFGATAGSAVGGAYGWMTAASVFWVVCDRRHPDRQPYFLGFDRCSFPSDESSGIGWFGGSFVGAAGAASMVAVWRGCPKRHAAWRAMVGAAIGSLPGILATNHSGSLGGMRSKVIAVTPVIAGLGAASAVVGCTS